MRVTLLCTGDVTGMPATLCECDTVSKVHHNVDPPFSSRVTAQRLFSTSGRTS